MPAGMKKGAERTLKLKALSINEFEVLNDGTELQLKFWAQPFERSGYFLRETFPVRDLVEVGGGDVAESEPEAESEAYRFADVSIEKDGRGNVLRFTISAQTSDGEDSAEYEMTGRELREMVNSGEDFSEHWTRMRRHPNDTRILYEETNTMINAYKIPILSKATPPKSKVAARYFSPTISCVLRGKDGKELSIWAMIDTGAEKTILDPAIADALGLERSGTATIGGYGGSVQTQFVRADVVFGSKSIDDLRNWECLVGRLNFDPAQEHSAYNPALMLGMDALMRYYSMINPKEKVMYLAS
jgi:hypothetical protein